MTHRESPQHRVFTSVRQSAEKRVSVEHAEIDDLRLLLHWHLSKAALSGAIVLR